MSASIVNPYNKHATEQNSNFQINAVNHCSSFYLNQSEKLKTLLCRWSFVIDYEKIFPPLAGTGVARG